MSETVTVSPEDFAVIERVLGEPARVIPELLALVGRVKADALREFAFFAREHQFPGDDAGNQFAEVWAKRAEGRALEIEAGL